MPSENMLIWRICKRLSPIGEPWRKPPPFFLGLRCAPPCQEWSNPYPLIKPDSWKVQRHCAASFDLQCEFDIICTTFDNALEINQRRNVLFDYIWLWTLISCVQFWLQICMSKVLSKKGKILPRDTQELVLSECLKRHSQGKWMYIWEIKNHLLWNSPWEMDRIRREILKTSILCPFSFNCSCVSSSFHMLVFISGRWEILSVLWGDHGKTHCSPGGIWLPSRSLKNPWRLHSPLYSLFFRLPFCHRGAAVAWGTMRIWHP